MQPIVSISAVALAVAAAASPSADTCTSAFEGCHLNGDCVKGRCVCDPWWSGTPDCSVMAFEPQDKDTGYFNHTETSWGGLPIQDPVTQQWNLFHAQMLNHCGLGSWSHNSIVARSVSETVGGPYTFQEMVLPNFAHNPTIRKVDGGYVIWYIGGWNMSADKCGAGGADALETENKVAAWSMHAPPPPPCPATSKIDPKTSLRLGGDYKDVELPAGAAISACVDVCCSDERCRGFSFNVASNASAVAPGCETAPGKTCCKLKDNVDKIVKNGCPQCTSGVVRPGSPPAPPPPPPACTGSPGWGRSCGQDMPGPCHDTCGPGGNEGCGVSMAFSKSLAGPWGHVQYLSIEDQWTSPLLYCAHTNPSPWFLPNGTVVMAVNAGFCHDNLETIGLVYADSWNGTWKMWTPLNVLNNPDGTPHKSEDPFLFKTKRGWHLLVHNQQGPQGESAYAYSEDGFSFTMSPTSPYGCTVTFTDGTTANAVGCGNRPQLVFSGPNGEPEWITNGAEDAKPWRSGTFTLFRKLKTSMA